MWHIQYVAMVTALEQFSWHHWRETANLYHAQANLYLTTSSDDLTGWIVIITFELKTAIFQRVNYEQDIGIGLQYTYQPATAC